MPAPTGIVDSLSAPPFASLQQVLDTSGPYAFGDHTLSTFTTSGAFLLPAGTYDVGGTYGVIVSASLFPANAGRLLGWNDAAEPILSGDTYFDRIAQICLIHQLPITGAHIITSTFDVHLPVQYCPWDLKVGSAGKVGLHVFPGWEVDLFYMCVL